MWGLGRVILSRHQRSYAWLSRTRPVPPPVQDLVRSVAPGNAKHAALSPAGRALNPGAGHIE